MPITVRPYDPTTDQPRWVELLNLVQKEPLTVETLQTLDQQRPAGESRQRVVARNEPGEVIGLRETLHEPWEPEGHLNLKLIVDPTWRQQGAGTLLYDDFLRFVQPQGATLLRSQVKDDDPAALQFAQQRGFEIWRHLFLSTLDVASFDETPFAGAIEAVEATGICFFTLADLHESEEAKRKLFELNRRAIMDMPTNFYETFPPYEEFCKLAFEPPWYRAEGQILAADGEQWVGLAAVAHHPQTNSMYHLFTAVEPPYRGRKIALALKLLTIRYARRYGVVKLGTDNDSNNAPMLAVNRKLGYQPEPGVYWLTRPLD
jgi:GNAT superfamily N-acetyltransferase